MSGRAAAEPPYYLAGEAREGICESEVNKTLHQSSHGVATRVHGFATRTKALAREIPPATQATRVSEMLFLHEIFRQKNKSESSMKSHVLSVLTSDIAEIF